MGMMDGGPVEPWRFGGPGPVGIGLPGENQPPRMSTPLFASPQEVPVSSPVKAIGKRRGIGGSAVDMPASPAGRLNYMADQYGNQKPWQTSQFNARPAAEKFGGYSSSMPSWQQGQKDMSQGHDAGGVSPGFQPMMNSVQAARQAAGQPINQGPPPNVTNPKQAALAVYNR